MNETDLPKLDQGDYELLVAYLDGELDRENCQVVEQRLAEDVDFRSELQQLQFTWDLLDEIPRVEASETFTQTTVEMVALSTEQDLQAEQTRQRRFSRLTHALLVGTVVAAAAASYVGFSTILARPNQQLIEDLTVIENVDLYRVAGSVEFLQRLDEEDLFSEEIDDDL